MASTHPSLHADNPVTDAPSLHADSVAGNGLGSSVAGGRPEHHRKTPRKVLREQRRDVATARLRAGWPAFDGLRPVLLFLCMPACLVLAITVTGGGWPAYILYPIALVLGAVVAVSALRGVELVLAVMLIYLPFSKVFVVPVAPGINGTNMLILLGLFAAILRLKATGQKLTDWPAGTWVVFAFAVLSAASAFTITLIPGGRQYLLYTEILSYKAWIDQFIFYFIALMCIRDVETAKRCMIYAMIGSVLVVLYSVPEMLEKSGRSTIEKSRIGGPHLQSNNFGGFVAYTILPLVALFISYIKDIKAWLLTPYFLLALKVLITTFSRGAYLAMVVGAMFAGWYRGKRFLLFWLAIGLSFALVFPSMIPEAIVDRFDTFNSTNSAAVAEDTLDKSSVTRLIMWRAAAQMIVEDPILGKGFKGFPLLKEDYMDADVKESDPHSMYLYIGSQMGLPALALFIVILGYAFWLGRYHSKNETDRFIRIIGIGGASATACFAVINLFGSRAVALNFSVYFWTFLVIMQVIRQRQLEEQATKSARQKRVTVSADERTPLNQASSPAMLPFQGRALRKRAAAAAEHKAAQDDGEISGRRSHKKRKRGAAAYQASIQASIASENTPLTSKTRQIVSPLDTQQSVDKAVLSKKRARRHARKRKSVI